MKKFAVALALAVVGFSSHASVISAYTTSAAFPYSASTDNLLPTSFTTSGATAGGGGTGVNLTYSFAADTEYVWFNFTTAQFDTLFARVTSADNTVTDFTRTVSSGSMFWGFTAANDDISSVRFFTTSAGTNSNVNNDRLTVTDVSGHVQSTEVPEPATTALLGLGLLGFAASRRKSARSKSV